MSQKGLQSLTDVLQRPVCTHIYKYINIKYVSMYGRLPLIYPCMEGLHFWSSIIVCSLNPVTAGHGSTNFGILASGMGGIGDSKREWEEKFDQQGLKMVILQ